MREILFRGKHIINGAWATGFIVDECHVGDWVNSDPVNSETIGQFTGLTDVEGTQIFEGDIVEPVLIDGTHKGFSWGRQVVVFDRGAFCLKSRRGEITPMCNYAANVKFKVWGNIHDNPELLEVSE